METSDEVTTRPVGRPRTRLTGEMKEEILDHLTRNIGIHETCHALGITHEMVVRNFEYDPHFAAQVATAEGRQTEQCSRLLLEVVVGRSCSLETRMKAAIAYLARKDRADAAAFARQTATRKAEAKNASNA